MNNEISDGLLKNRLPDGTIRIDAFIQILKFKQLEGFKFISVVNDYYPASFEFCKENIKSESSRYDWQHILPDVSPEFMKQFQEITDWDDELEYNNILTFCCTSGNFM